jgi:hypothetical protein
VTAILQWTQGKSFRSGVTVLQRPWPLAKVNGCINVLVWETLTGIVGAWV